MTLRHWTRRLVPLGAILLLYSTLALAADGPRPGGRLVSSHAATGGKKLPPGLLGRDWRPGMTVRWGAPFSPNDPYFLPDLDLKSIGQWHLENNTDYFTAQGQTIDANLRGAWDAGWTGAGVTIGFVDDGMQYTHDDLAANYAASKSYDFGQMDADPAPVRENEYIEFFGVPFAIVNGDNHGTAVAGVAAGVGGNGIGITGAAPAASIAALRVPFDVLEQDAPFAAATRAYSTGTDTGIDIKNHSYGSPIAYDPFPEHREALAESIASGTIHVFAAGNMREFEGQEIGTDEGVPLGLWVDADTNKSEMQNVAGVINVGALRLDGLYAEYSNWGANLFVTAPSSGTVEVDLGDGLITTYNAGILTTDNYNPDNFGLDGYNYFEGTVDFGGGFALDPDGDAFGDLDYTGAFGGTSAAAPLVAGIIALGQQAARETNGVEMDARMAMHLLARSSDSSIDAGDVLEAGEVFTTEATGGWTTNAAGFRFNLNYGFGLIDAGAFTELATQYGGVSAEVIETIGETDVNLLIPDHDATNPFASATFALTGTTALEQLEVSLDISHEYRGQLEAFLISPSGTASRLFYRNGPVFGIDPLDPFGPLIQIGTGDMVDDIDWTFITNAFWGENPNGLWTIRIYDRLGEVTGRWNSFSVRARMGTLLPLGAVVPEPGSWVMAGLGLVGVALLVRRRGFAMARRAG